MAFAYCYPTLSLFIILSYLTLTNQEKCPFDTIYQIGDSTSDSGNLIRVPGVGPTITAARPPYGKTFPGNPSGRNSDGQLIIDYLATKLGLPLLNPYLDRNASFTNGVNFAVAGATALDISFLATKGVTVPNLDTTPLNAQIDWFRQYLNSTCSTPAECAKRLDRAVIVLGDVGKNDIEYGLSQNKTIQEIMDYVPFIPQAVANATRVLIELGATNIIVPGTFPLGCLPANLVLLPKDKDDQGCSIALNNLSTYFNILLRESLISLTFHFPRTRIIYADYYNAFDYLLRDAPALGFDGSSSLKACCGIGEPYNYDKNRMCGSPEVPVCPNPAQYIQWDGAHLTQEAHRRITDYLFPDILTMFHCSP